MKLESFLTFEPVGQRIDELETPTPVIDIDVVEANLRKWQERCDALGIANRPHIKTHKLAGVAKFQVALGAKGITVQKVGEAEVMADAGITDMLLTFNIVGASKLKRLAAVAKRVDLSVVADHSVVVEGLGTAGLEAGRDISVLVECDTGGRRNGVQSPEATAELARVIDATDGVSYGGLMTYTRPGTRLQAQAFFSEAAALAKKAGLETKVTSTGGSPEMWSDEGLEGMSEYRAGTYAYFDRSLVERGTCTWDDCALRVLTTIVSRPTDERALIDAGSKALTMDLLGHEGYGVVRSLGGAQVYDLNEEHGYLDISKVDQKPSIGDLVFVTPNHVCPVTNLYDRVVFVRGDDVLGAVKVDARGKVQ
jgi:D-serine deaminase-like pyridoxal phosphate-dependent protein